MNLYRNVTNIVIGETILILSILGVCGAMLSAIWPLAKSNHADILLIVILLFMTLISVVIYRGYCIFFHIKESKKPTIIVTEKGLSYPYFLKDNTEFKWEDIKDIRYVEDGSGQRKSYYVIIEFEAHIKLGKLKFVPWLLTLTQIQKKYDTEILVVFYNIVQDYSLFDLAECLNSERLKLDAPLAYMRNEAVIKNRKPSRTPAYYIRVIIMIFIELIAFHIFIRDYKSPNTEIFQWMFVGIIMVTVAYLVRLIRKDYFDNKS